MKKSGERPGRSKKIPQLETERTMHRGETEQILHGVFYNPRTELYSSEYFNHRIETEIVRANRNKHSLGVLLCNLHHLKIKNEASVHQARDESLKIVSRGIREATRGTDLAFQWKGDEILVILSDTLPDGILIASDRIRRRVRKLSERTDLPLDLHIGAALCPEHGNHADELVRVARRALSIAKKGKDKIHIGKQDYHLSEHSINVVFQPIVDIRVNQLIGYEALSRDHKNTRSILDLFKIYQPVGYEAFSRDPQHKLSILDLFKRYRAIGQLHELKRICFGLQLKAAQGAGLERVFLNVDFNLLNKMESASRPRSTEVILEISELEALHDVEDHLKTAKKWQEGGFKFAIDDFGAGYVSLPFIAQLIPEYIKLDRSTLVQAVSSEKFRVFLRDLLQALENYVTAGFIAEGVETEQELQVVRDMGVSYVQGFFLGKPQKLKKIRSSKD